MFKNHENRKNKKAPKQSLFIAQISTDLSRIWAKITPELPRGQKWQKYL